MSSRLRNALRGGVTLAAAATLVTLQTVSSDASGASADSHTGLRPSAEATIQPTVKTAVAFGVSGNNTISVTTTVSP